MLEDIQDLCDKQRPRVPGFRRNPCVFGALMSVVPKLETSKPGSLNPSVPRFQIDDRLQRRLTERMESRPLGDEVTRTLAALASVV